MEILRKNKKEILEVKNIETEMKRAFDYQKKHAEERTAELDNISIETSKTEKQREQRLRTRTEYPDRETTTKAVRYTSWEYQKERKEMKGTEETNEK